MREKNILSIIFLFFIFCVLHGEDKKEVKVDKSTPPPHRKLAPIIKYSDYSFLIDGKVIEGFWKVIKWHAYFYVPAKDWNKPVFMKFQWYKFTDKGVIKLMSSHKSHEDGDVADKLKRSDSALRYEFLQKGLMQVSSSDNKSVNELWRSAEITKDIEFKTTGFKFQKGDVVQSLLDDSGKVLYVRQMRRIKL